MWVVYGLPLVHPKSMLVITINGAGTVIELTYILLFLIYSNGKQRLKVLVMLIAQIIFVIGLALLVIGFAHTYYQRSMIVGILCVFFGTMMYASPLSVMVCQPKTYAWVLCCKFVVFSWCNKQYMYVYMLFFMYFRGWWFRQRVWSSCHCFSLWLPSSMVFVGPLMPLSVLISTSLWVLLLIDYFY